MIYVYFANTQNYTQNYIHIFLFEQIGNSFIKKGRKYIKVKYHVEYNSLNDEVEGEGEIGPGVKVYGEREVLTPILAKKIIRVIFDRIPKLEG
jgi:hypothetical protein